MNKSEKYFTLQLRGLPQGSTKARLVIICGDLDQVDIAGKSGLKHAIDKRIHGAEVFEFELE